MNPVAHTHQGTYPVVRYGYRYPSTAYYSGYHGSYGYGWYPWCGFSVGIAFGYSSYWSGYGYYGPSCYIGYRSPAACYPTWCAPYWNVSYCSPYSYRYYAYPGYSYYYPYYRGSYYVFSSLYGWYPYYCSSYSYYRGYDDTPATITVVEQPAAPARELSTGELNFCEGWTLLRAGSYEAAGEVLYSASLELEQSALVHLYLAVALAGTGDRALAARALGEAIALDPELLRHRWSPTAHLGAEGEATIRAQLSAARADDPTAPSALAIEATLALLSSDAERGAELRGAIAESLILHPDAPVLAEELAELRRRDVPEGTPLAGHSDPAVAAWLLDPSCERIPELGLLVE